MSRVLLAISLLLLASVAIAQTSSRPSSISAQGAAQPPVKQNPLVPYAGNWVSTFEDKPWMLLSLNLVGEQFSGSMQRAKKINLNDNGEVNHVSEEFLADHLVDGKLNPDGLLLIFKDSDTQETFRYQMKLTGESTAEIKMIAMEMPPGMPKPKPWKLTKTAPANPQRQR
jgi:hypothetical protein